MMVTTMMGKAVRQLTRAAFVMGALTLGTVVTVMLVSEPEETVVATDRVPAAAGWGNEALSVVHEGASRMSPIPLANACGMGASSCFKCHNGKRAAAPSMESASAPWHTQHKTVNNSCVGCHQGNPRVMKQDVSHKGLIGNPRSDTATACVGCHTGADVNELNKHYMSLAGGGK
jgi:hypothetical protein